MFSKRFICASDSFCDYDKYVSAPLFRKSIIIDKIPQAANFTICGLGFYELYINGFKITKGALAPYINNPDDILYYDFYDLLPHLREGENIIGVMLGNGFFNPFGGTLWDFDKAPWRGPLRLAFSLEMENDGDRVIVEADESVKVSDSAVVFDELRIGAFYDARLEQNGWNKIGFDDSGWKNARIISAPKGEPRICLAEPVKIYKELKPVSIKYLDDFCFCCEAAAKYEEPIEYTRVKNTYVYDFGENNSGICKLKIKGKAGQQVILRFGEDMVDGKFSLRSTINMYDYENFYFDYPQIDKYILKGGGIEEYIPSFTYHGFRYVLVEGITQEQATEELLTYLVMSSDMKNRADFSCSDEQINKLYEMSCRADRANFLYIPTDCPHREKNGWTADISLSAEHMLLNMKTEKSMQEWLRNVAKAQRQSGELPGIIPTAGWGFEWGNGPIWDSVCVYLPYYCYKYSGDIEVVSENIDMIFKYLRYISTKRDDRGLIEIGLEDWAQPNYIAEDTLAPVLFTDSAMVFDMAQKAAFLAEIYGDGQLSAEALKFASEMKLAIREHLIDFSSMTAMGNCQTSQSIAIKFGIFEAEEIPCAVDRLIHIIHKSDDRLLCGVLGARFIFHILARYGHIDLAMKMITSPEYPSYMQWVNNGCTALCEAFVPEGKGDKNFRDSKNHHFWGDISSFFIQDIVGIKPNPNCRDIKEFEISPNFAACLENAEAEYLSECGKISVAWEKIGNDVKLTVEAPEEVKGNFVLPEGYAFEGDILDYEIKSGNFTIVKNAGLEV